MENCALCRLRKSKMENKNSSRVYPSPRFYDIAIVSKAVNQSQSLLVVCFRSPDLAFQSRGCAAALFPAEVSSDNQAGSDWPVALTSSSPKHTLTPFAPGYFRDFAACFERHKAKEKPNCKMASKYAFGKGLKELRFLFCQTSEPSAATR